jgi:hypothetical protein
LFYGVLPSASDRVASHKGWAVTHGGQTKMGMKSKS